MRPFFYLASLPLLFVFLCTMLAGGPGASPARADVWGKLYIKTEPPQAQIRFLKIKYDYSPGIILRDGKYTVAISAPGYEDVTKEVRVVGGENNTFYVSLPPQKTTNLQQASPATVQEKAPQKPTSKIWGKLFIDTDPAGADIRFLKINYAYKPGIILREGTYLVEVSKPGVGKVQKEVPLFPGVDNRYLIKINDPLEKSTALQIPTTGLSEPSSQEPGKLIVITDPPGVPVRFVDADLRYTPGMPLAPGHYLIEVSDTEGRKVVKEVDITSGRETRILASLDPDKPRQRLPESLQNFAIPSLSDKQKKQPQTMAPPPPPKTEPMPAKGQLLVYTEPADAHIRLRNNVQAYQPGMSLPAGSYEIEVSKDGFTPLVEEITVVGGKLQRVGVRLRKKQKMSGLPSSLKNYAIQTPRKRKERGSKPAAAKAAQGSLRLNITPTGSVVYFLNVNMPYTPGVRLPAGRYKVKISKSGYESVTLAVEIKAGKELEAQIRLKPVGTAVSPAPPAPGATARQAPAATPFQKPGPAAPLSLEQIYVQEGSASLASGQYQEALRQYGKALHLDPQMAEAFKGRGFVYYKLGKYKRAVKEYDKSLTFAPDDAQAFYERGNAYLAAGSKKHALQDYNKAIALNSAFPDAYNARGTVHYAHKQYLNALEDYTRALGIDASYTDAYFNRAATHMQLGMYELAVKDYDAVLRIDPWDRGAAKKRKQALKKLGK